MERYVVCVGGYELECVNIPSELKEIMSKGGVVDLGKGVAIEEKKSNYRYKGRSLRDLMVEMVDEKGFSEYEVGSIKLVDKCVEALEKLYKYTGSISVDLVKYITESIELGLCTDDVDWSPIEVDGEKCLLVKNIETYTENRYESMIKKCSDVYKEKSPFTSVITKTEFGYEQTEVSYNCGLVTYMENCKLLGNSIPYKPLDDFVEMMRGKGEYMYCSTKFMCAQRLGDKLKDKFIGEIIQKMYVLNPIQLFESDMTCYLMIEYEEGKIKMVDWSVVDCGFEDDTEGANDPRNSIISYVLQYKDWNFPIDIMDKVDELVEGIRNNMRVVNTVDMEYEWV